MGLTERGDQRVRYLWREDQEVAMRAGACAGAGPVGTASLGESCRCPTKPFHLRIRDFPKSNCAINRWGGLLLQVCVARVRQLRAMCSLDLYELSVFVCISWGKKQGERLLREWIIPLWPQPGKRRG